MSTDQKPTNPDAELGITFTEKQSPTPEMREGGLKMPTTPTIEEMTKDTEAARQSGVFNVSEAFNAKHDLGTIVTDKKKRKISLSDNLGSAWNEWWRHTKKAAKPVLETMAKPKRESPKISKVETRVEVVENAAVHASMAPKDDHKVTIEKIKTFKQDVEKVTGVPFTVKEGKKSEPAWTHTVEPQKIERPVPPPPRGIPTPPPDLRTSMVAPVVEKHIEKDIADYARKSEEKRVEVPKRTNSPTQIAYMRIPGTVERKDRPQAIRAQIAPLVQTKKEEVVPQHTELAPKKEMGYIAREDVKKAAELVKRPIEAPIPPEFSVASPSQNESTREHEPTFHSESRDTASRAYLTPRTPLFSPKLILPTLSGVVLISATLAIFIIVQKGTEPEMVMERETPEVETFFDAGVPSAIPLTPSRSEFFASFMNTLNTEGKEFIQLYPTLGEGAETRIATTEEFFTTLGMRTPEKMLRTLEENFMLGGVGTAPTEPFIVIRSYNFDTLFAGMLEWESRLRQDFSPLFDASYVEADVFTDTIIDNRPARVLNDVRDEEVLIYTIVGKNTVIISSSRDALEMVLEQL